MSRLACYTEQAVKHNNWAKASLMQPRKTHTFLDASGKAYVPDHERLHLCKIMAKDFWMHGNATACSIAEIIDPERIGFCLDCDFKDKTGAVETRDQLLAYSRCMIKTIVSFFKDDVSAEDMEHEWRFIGLCNGVWKLHVYLPPCRVNLECMLNIRKAIVDDLTSEFGARESPKNSWADVVDDKIYTRSLRAPLTRKYKFCSTCGGHSTAKKICSNEDCVRGRVPLGNETIYAVEYVLKMDGTEDLVMLAHLQGREGEFHDHAPMFEKCTVWHWNMPLTPWRMPIGRSILDAIPKRPSEREIAAYCSSDDDDNDTSSSSSSKKRPEKKKKKKEKSYAAQVKYDRHEVEKHVHQKSRVTVVIEKHDARFQCLQRIITAGKLGTNYKNLDLTGLMTDRPSTIMFGTVRGDKDRVCELATDKETGKTKQREHKSARIYLQVNRTHPAAIYWKCWHPVCHEKKKRSFPYFLDGPEFYTLFPSAAPPSLLATPASSLSSSSSSFFSSSSSSSFNLPQKASSSSSSSSSFSVPQKASYQPPPSCCKVKEEPATTSPLLGSQRIPPLPLASCSSSSSSVTRKGQVPVGGEPPRKRRRLASSNLLDSLLSKAS
jgi:hypothetical protein